MKIRSILSFFVVAGMLLPALAPAARAGGDVETATPGEGVGASSPPGADAPTAWLKGPFGRVPGGTESAPAGADPDARALDAWVLQAPLELQFAEGRVPTSLVVTATPLDGASATVTLSDGATTFVGPDRAGHYLVVADVASGSGAAAPQAWLVTVPDRAPPADGVLDIPAPDIIVSSDSGMVTGWPGTGCYAYLCVEVGTTPPPATLQSLAVDVGETLRLSLADGSAMSAWRGSLTPDDGGNGPTLTAGGVAIEGPEARIDLTGLEVPESGRWLLALEVEFDRERGFLRPFYVLEAR